ncbi:hypothetical protein P4K44_33815 [Bacillus cereus]|uniref:hypothetical protein n=1 Tax=Bacillus pumilus TaxID=1408 RepID=UPI002DB72943|nr:hypothetical protein [Bacillus pumilus]MEB9770476.1 hypothetical protein [Bacillus cereus]MED1527891.1 hypothetical protein [Bacillus pumilus]
MTEEKRTIHVLKDEKLGVDREYVAVDRGAVSGEKIVIVEKTSDRDVYSEGDVFTVDRLWGAVGGSVESDKAVSGTDYNKTGLITRSEYHVLEPTDIVHIDGERYRLEDRKAEVGEKIIITNSEDFPIGHISAIEKFDDNYDDGSCYLETGSDGEYYFDGESERHLVLTPVQDATEPKESDVITVLANLGAEVAELKRTVARHQAEINALHEDKVRLGEQLAKVVADDPKALSLTAAEIAHLIVSLKKAGL